MSTKTTFKRIALVAVAALGLGVLSVAPSSATVSSLTLTATNGTSTNSADGYVSDSTTAASLVVAGLLDTQATDSVTVTFVAKSAPSGATAVPFAYYNDSTTPLANTTFVDSISAVSAVTGDIAAAGQKKVTGAAAADTSTAALAVDGTISYRITRGSGAGYVSAKFLVQLDSVSARTGGTYTYTAVVKSFSAVGTTSTLTNTQTVDLSIVVPDAASESETIDPSKTTAYINSLSAANTSSDSAVAVVATAASTDHATITVKTYNAASTLTAESVTATLTGPGLICNGGVCGKSLSLIGTGGSTAITVRADGNAGVASIVIKTTTVTFPAKTVTFFAKAAKTITLAVNKPVIAVGSATDVVRATISDADGNVWGGAAYIVAATAADALIAGSSTPVACTYDSTYKFHACPVAGIAKGTANFNVIDASTVAAATATSASTAAVRVSTGVATTAKISFDKATYAPGEKATVLVTVLDADGNALPAQTISNAFTAAITSSVALGSQSDSLASSATVTLAAATSATSATTAGSQQYTIYMPVASGDVTLSATGSTGLAAAGRVAISATASVVNSSVDAATDAANEATDAANAATDAALAAADAADAATAAAQDASDAVAALSASVSKLISQLRAQITSLTNLVIKIQKKVKA